MSGVSSLQFCARRGLGQATLVLLLDKETVRKFERLSPGSSGCPVEGRWLVGRASPLSTLSELCPHFYTGISSCTRLLDGLAFCAIIGGFQNKLYCTFRFGMYIHAIIDCQTGSMCVGVVWRA